MLLQIRDRVTDTSGMIRAHWPLRAGRRVTRGPVPRPSGSPAVLASGRRSGACRVGARRPLGQLGTVGEHALGDLLHRQPQVHGGLLDPPEGLGLGEVEPLLQDALGAVDQLAGLQPLGQVGDLRLELAELGEAAQRHLDGRHEVVLGERLDQVGHRTGVAGPLDQLALAEGGEDDDRGDALRGDGLGRGDAVELGHLDVEDDQVGPVLAGQRDRGLAVAGLADDLEVLLGQHLGEVHADERLVLGDDDAAPRPAGVRLARRGAARTARTARRHGGADGAAAGDGEDGGRVTAAQSSGWSGPVAPRGRHVVALGARGPSRPSRNSRTSSRSTRWRDIRVASWRALVIARACPNRAAERSSHVRALRARALLTPTRPPRPFPRPLTGPPCHRAVRM